MNCRLFPKKNVLEIKKITLIIEYTVPKTTQKLRVTRALGLKEILKLKRVLAVRFYYFMRKGEDFRMELSLAQNAKSAILLHVNTGEILYEKNMNERLPPASLTKMMTVLLIFEQLKKGGIRLTDKVRLSPWASSVRGSKVAIDSEEELSVEDLIKCIVMASANNAAIGMAEYIAGTCQEFADMMRKKAGEMGLENSNFLNPHGLDHPGHYSSALDMAILSQELLKSGEILNYSSKYRDTIKKDSKNPLELINTNKLLRNHPEIDGLKTGRTRLAKACLSVTACKNNNRVLAVVMGEPTRKIRNKEIIDMLDYAWLRIYG